VPADRLARIEERQDEMIAALASLEHKVDTTNGFVLDLRAEVGRVPLLAARGTRLTVTDRLHAVEGVVTPVAIEAAVHRALDARRNTAWTRGQKAMLFMFAAVACVIGLLNFLGLGG
jgi:uncharacterized protein (DUF1778 family)